MIMEGKLPLHEVVPRQFRGLARAALMPVSEAARIFGIGEMSEDIRERFAIPFSDDDQQKLDDLRGVSRLLWKRVPAPLLYNGEAYDARLRETGGKHRNTIDHMTYMGMSIGTTVLKRTVSTARSLSPIKF